MAANYLIDILDNKGEPSLKMRAYLAFGQVDGSGTVSRGVAKITKVGEKIGGERATANAWKPCSWPPRPPNAQVVEQCDVQGQDGRRRRQSL